MSTHRRLSRSLVLACGLVFALGCGDDDGGGGFEPVAVISATPSAGPAPLTVTFDGSGSQTSSTTREYQWDLGDGSFDDRETFEHTYSTPGYYRVTLAVWDADRNAGTDSADISVAADRPLSISGAVAAVPNQFTDSDTNNPAAPDGPNDDRADAQGIARTPAFIGGFLAATPTGKTGDRFASSPDEADWYAVDLDSGQTVQLAIADWTSADPARFDFDLFLFDAASGSLFDASVGDGRFETVQVTDAGRYLIEVRAIRGFSNYTVSVGATPSASSTRELRSSAALVPGEVLVRHGLGSKAVGVATEPLGLEVVAEGRSEVLLGRLSPVTVAKSGGSGAAPPALGARAEAFSDEQLEKLRTLYEIKRLRARADIDHAEPNYVLHPTLTPDDPSYPTQWHYPLIGLPQAWELSTGSASIIVAVVDTGVFLAHSDLQGRLIDGYDFIQDPARALDGDGIDPNPDDPGNGAVLELSSFHGTHVAGTLGAETNNALGVAGVSWGAQIMPVRVIGQGGGTSFDVLEGVRYAAGLENTSATLPPRRADIINLSLGGSPFSQFEQDVYAQVREAGVIVISAAGNDAVSEPSYPASYDGVVSVSAVGPDKQRAPYSNFGMFVDVAAPGGNLELDLNEDGLPDGVLSTSVGFDAGERTSAVRFMEGTSMASPHMAGVAALMRSVYADLTPAELDALLQSGSITEDLGDEGRDDVYGYGLIDGVRALQEAARLAGGGDLPSLLRVSPSVLVFEPGISELTLEVAQVGAEPLSVQDISASDEWIVEVTELDVDQAGLGTYRVVVDRTGLPDGAYLSTITFLASNGESSAVGVSMRVGAESGPGDTGLVFVALVDASRPGEIREIVNAGAGEGIYEYSFAELDAGIYFVAAGTDNDNDGDLCDEGEACGAYATLSLPDGIRLGSDDVADRDFLVGYRPDILAAQAAGAPSASVRLKGEAGSLSTRVGPP